MDESMRDRAAVALVSAGPDTWPLSARDAAALLGVSKRTSRRAIGRGNLHATKRSGIYRVERLELERFQQMSTLTTIVPLLTSRVKPRLRALPELESAISSSLPTIRTPLIGRERELDEIGTLLNHPDLGLLTMTGTGWCWEDTAGVGGRKRDRRSLL